MKDNQQTVSPMEHLSRVADGEFPQDTRDFLQAMFNQGMRDSRHKLAYDRLTGSLPKFQRDRCLRELWAMRLETSAQGRAKGLLSDYRRFCGRVVPGKPQTRLYARIQALEEIGVRIPGCKQIMRICGGLNGR